MSKLLQIQPSFVLNFSTSFDNMKRLAKGTALEPFFDGNKPVGCDISIISSLNDYVQNKDITGSPLPVICTTVENIIVGGVDPFEAMKYGKVYGDWDKMVMFFETMKPTTFIKVAKADSAKTLRLFLYGLCHQALLSPAVASLAKSIYFDPLNIPSPADNHMPSDGVTPLIGYRISDIEDKMDQIDKRIAALYKQQNETTMTQPESTEPESVKKEIHLQSQSADDHYMIIQRDLDTIVKVCDGEHVGEIYRFDGTVDTNSLSFVGKTLTCKVDGNTKEAKELKFTEQMDVFWDIIERVTSVSTVLESGIIDEESNANWEQFDSLLSSN